MVLKKLFIFLLFTFQTIVNSQMNLLGLLNNEIVQKSYESYLESENSKIKTNTTNYLEEVDEEDSKYLSDPGSAKDISIALMDIIKDSISEIIEYAYTVKKNVSKTCYDAVKYSYSNETYNYIFKSLVDSAKNKNDMGSYNDCIHINYEDKVNEKSKPENILTNITYYLIKIIKGSKQDTDFKSLELDYLLGVCFIKQCSENDIQNLIWAMDEKKHLLNLTRENHDDIKAINVQKTDKDDNSNGLLWGVFLIPFYLFIIHFLFTIIPSFALKLFKLCYSRKKYGNAKVSGIKSNENSNITSNNMSSSGSDDEELQQQRYSSHKGIYYRFKKAFSFSDNFEELISANTQNKHSPAGINHIRGLRSLAIVLTILGNVFFILYNSPLKIYSIEKMDELIRRFNFFLITLGIRNGPRLLLAYSGYLLAYKFYWYLTNEVIKDVNQTQASRISINNQTLSNMNVVDEKRNSLLDDDRNSLRNSETGIENDNRIENVFNQSSSFIEPQNYATYEASWKFFFKYFIYKFHKYILYIWSVLFFAYSFYTVVGFLYFSMAPLWTYFKKKFIDDFREYDFLLTTIFPIHPFFKDKWNPYFLAINEILFYTIFVVVLFLYFKNKWRVDLHLCILIIISLVGKLLYYLYKIRLNDSDEVSQSNNNKYEVYNTLYFFSDLNGLVQTHPIFNLTSYLIGIFFGLLHFVYQKSTNEDAINKTIINNFLKYFKCINKFFTDSKSKKCRFWTFIVIDILLIIGLSIWNVIVNINFDDTKELLKNPVINFIMLFDCEIFVFCVLFGVYLISLSSNQIMKFVEHDYWGIINKTYFIFILNFCPTIFFVFYQSESRIKIGLFNTVFFFLFILILTFISNFFLYIIQEMPLKKLSLLFIQEKFRNDANEDVENLHVSQEREIQEEEKQQEEVDNLTLHERNRETN